MQPPQENNSVSTSSALPKAATNDSTPNSAEYSPRDRRRRSRPRPRASSSTPSHRRIRTTTALLLSILPPTIITIFLPPSTTTTAAFLQPRTAEHTRFPVGYDAILPLRTSLRSSTAPLPPVGDQIDDEDDSYLYPTRREGVFQNTNLISRTMEVPDPLFWDALLPRTLQQPNHRSPLSFWDAIASDGLGNLFGRGNSGPAPTSTGVDVSVDFTDAGEGANELVRRLQACDCGCDAQDGDNGSHKAVTAFIREVFSYYQESVPSPHHPSTVERGGDGAVTRDCTFRTRVVSTNGPSGQKCPRWHVDHVPVRLVMSIVGPGCTYISHDAEFAIAKERTVDREALNELIEFDTARANALILPCGEDGLAETAGVGEAIVMMGRAWEDADRRNVGAVPHRSPDLVEGEGRILLTVDVLPHDI